MYYKFKNKIKTQLNIYYLLKISISSYSMNVS